MNKKELITAIIEKTEQSVSEVTKTLDTFFDVIAESITKDKVAKETESILKQKSLSKSQLAKILI